jgi:hypothetical protein
MASFISPRCVTVVCTENAGRRYDDDDRKKSVGDDDNDNDGATVDVEYPATYPSSRPSSHFLLSRSHAHE